MDRRTGEVALSICVKQRMCISVHSVFVWRPPCRRSSGWDDRVMRCATPCPRLVEPGSFAFDAPSGIVELFDHMG